MNSLPTHLKNRKSQAVSAEIISGLGSPQPPHVSIQGGRFTLVDAAGNKKPLDSLNLDCVIIDGKKGRSRVFWGVGAVFEGEQSGPPLCWSDNDIGPSSQAAQPQSQTCATCVMARWDSDISKMTGKPVPACKTMKKLALMLPGFSFPFQLRVPVMSHSSLQSYSAQFNTGDFDVSDVITRISFVEGKTGELQFDFLEMDSDELPFIDEATMKLRDSMLNEKKTDVLVGRNDVPWQGALPGRVETLGQAQVPASRQIAPPQKPVTPATPAFGVAPGEAKKGGRPPGSKNKPKQNGFATAKVDKIETGPQQSVAQEMDDEVPTKFGVQEADEPPDELSDELTKAFKLPT